MELYFTEDITREQEQQFVEAIAHDFSVDITRPQNLVVADIRQHKQDGEIVPGVAEAHVITLAEFEAQTPNAGHWYVFACTAIPVESPTV